MEVLILSKTHFGNNVCVGGMVLETNQYLRLLNPGRWYPYADTPLSIGDIWDMRFSATTLTAPHVEDVIVTSQRRLRTTENLSNFLMNKGVEIWQGDIINIFNGKLLWANSGAGYLSENIEDYPPHSVGFWLSNKPLILGEDDHYTLLSQNTPFRKKIKY